ncbi:UvrD-helicase domain-containing protein [Pseudalkalibacillus caeni]|uniref:DNA 3'-5' helicase n=1 Tax=Exobacillus caeni TaxID=2574798 RepID=A0A5R9FDQ9_9BACL|nr:UvrD-helicase domain-containing protein [Pseudalkalibacillus caeni]TLS39013.1 DNA helicase UvrD [Pseudalkalibacillus caeni]
MSRNWTGGFSDQEAEALPAKSELPRAEINAAIASQFLSNVKLIEQQNIRKERNFKTAGESMSYSSLPFGVKKSANIEAPFLEHDQQKTLQSVLTPKEQTFFSELEHKTIFLNSNQMEAVRHTEGPLLTIAGAGSGKTSVLTTRTAYLIGVKEIDPSQILLITFTKKAAEEMKQRIASLPGISSGEAKQITAGTFHSFFLRMLRNLKITDRILSSEKYKQIIIKNILRQSQLSPKKQYFPEVLLSLISSYKLQMIKPEDLSEDAADKDIQHIYEKYEAWKRQNGYMDFDDILLKSYELLLSSPNLLKMLQQRFTYVMADEFQDTNPIQYELLKLIASPQNNLFAVGDDDQVIYSFNGADSEIILDFHKDFPNTRVIKLDTNYRSTSPIVGFGNHIIKHNSQRHSKTMKAVRRSRMEPQFYRPSNTEEEAETIVNRLKDKPDTRSWSDYAILFRTHSNARAMFEQLIIHNLPFTANNMKQVFYDQTIIKGLIDHLRLVMNPGDLDATATILPSLYINQEAGMRYIEMENFVDPLPFPLLHLTTWNTLKDFQKGKVKKRVDLLQQATGLSPVEAIRSLRKEYENHLDTGTIENATVHKTTVKEMLDELEFSAQRFHAIPDFLAFVDEIVNKFYEKKEQDSSEDQINLMSIHQAKGLEFPVVFLIGASEGILPHVSALNAMQDKEVVLKDKTSLEKASMEEERRLCYVGVTRAKDELYISSPAFHLGKNAPVSRFLLQAFGTTFYNKDNSQRTEAWICMNKTCNGWMKIDVGNNFTEKQICAICGFEMQKGKKNL